MNKKYNYLLILLGLLISFQAKSQQLFNQLGAELSLWNRSLPFTEKTSANSDKEPIILFSVYGVSKLGKQVNLITKVGYSSQQQVFNQDVPQDKRIELKYQVIPVHLGVEYNIPLSGSTKVQEGYPGLLFLVQAGIDRYFELNHILQYNSSGTRDDDSRNGGNYYGFSGGVGLEKRYQKLTLGITARYRGAIIESEVNTESETLQRNSPSGFTFGLRVGILLSKPENNSSVL